MNVCLKLVFVSALVGLGDLIGGTTSASAQQVPPMPKEAIDEMLHIEGWFVSGEKDNDGKFSHCQMMNPYFYGESAVLLTFTLSPERKGLVVVVDPHAGRIKPSVPAKGTTGAAAPPAAANPAMARQGVYAFDGQADRTVPATFAGTLTRLEIPNWDSFRSQLVVAKRIRIAGPDRDRTFNLYGVPEAVTALERCAMERGLPPPTPTAKPADPNSAPKNPAAPDAKAQTGETAPNGEAEKPTPPGFGKRR